MLYATPLTIKREEQIMGPYKHKRPKVREIQPDTKASRAAIAMGNLETEVEMDQLQYALSQAKTMGEKDKILSRFLNRASSQQEHNIKERGQTPRVRTKRKGGSVSRKGGGTIEADTIFDLTKNHLRKKRREKEKRLTPESETNPKAKVPSHRAKKAKKGGKIMVGYKAGGKV